MFLPLTRRYSWQKCQNPRFQEKDPQHVSLALTTWQFSHFRKKENQITACKLHFNQHKCLAFGGLFSLCQKSLKYSNAVHGPLKWNINFKMICSWLLGLNNAGILPRVHTLMSSSISKTFHGFFHYLFQFSMTLGLAVFENVQNFPWSRVFLT